MQLRLPFPRPAPAAPRRSRGSSGGRGQSLVEFGLVLPVLLAFLGLTIDFARVYQAWITLESATRDAAEAAATSSPTSGDAQTQAQKTICLQTQSVPGFLRSAEAAPADVEQCVAPVVTVVSFDLSTTAPGYMDGHPIGTATVEARLPFSPIIAWPLITQGGQWTIVTRSTFSISQGRT